MDRPVQFGKNGVVLAHAGVVSRSKLLAPLAHNDGSGLDLLSWKHFDSESSSNGISTVVGRTTLLLRSHCPYGSVPDPVGWRGDPSGQRLK